VDIFIGVVLGDGGPDPHFLEWEDGPHLIRQVRNFAWSPTLQTKVTLLDIFPAVLGLDRLRTRLDL